MKPTRNPRSSYRSDDSSKKMTPIKKIYDSPMQASNFWTPSTVDKSSSDLPRTSEKGFTKEKYKWLMVKFDMERDNRLT